MGRAGWAWGGIVGPVAFGIVWAVAGLAQERYSPVDDAISALAAVDAPARVPMTVGLVALGTGMLLFAAAVRESVEGPAWVGAVVTGLATLGVAATPLGWTAAVDDVHAVLALVGYASLVAVPLMAAGRIKPKGLTRLSRHVGILAGMCLTASVLDVLAPGLFQRAGLTLVHGWVVGAAASILSSPGTSAGAKRATLGPGDRAGPVPPGGPGG